MYRYHFDIKNILARERDFRKVYHP